jgi:hypothetical protein
MFQRNRKSSDFGAEIEAPIELEAERLREQGLTDEDALTAARRAFGNVTKAQERFYESSHWLWWDHFGKTFASPRECCARLPASPPSRF